MTIDQCIELAERECQEPPCEHIATCDEADCCLVAEQGGWAAVEGLEATWPYDDDPYDGSIV